MRSKRKEFTKEQIEFLEESIKTNKTDISAMFFKKFSAEFTKKQVYSKMRFIKYKIENPKTRSEMQNEIIKEIVEKHSKTMNQSEMLKLYNEATGNNVKLSGFSLRIKRLGLRKERIYYPTNFYKKMSEEDARRFEVSQKFLKEFTEAAKKVESKPKPKQLEPIGHKICFVVNGKTYEGNLDKKSNDIYEKMMGKW